MTDDVLAAEVADALAVVLGFPLATLPQRVTDAAAASVRLARRYCYGDGPDSTLEFPDPTAGPELFAGLTALATRVYHDPASPSGVVGGDAYTGIAIPEDVLAHVHHYLDPYRTAWGVA